MRRWTASTLLVGLVLSISWLFIAPPGLGGHGAFVSTFGISMEPRVSAGDLVVTWRSDSYDVGDVAAYRSDTIDTVVLHRIVERDAERFVFQGDNNDWLDPDRPVLSELIGKEILRIPQGAIWLSRLSSPPAIAVFLFLLLSGGAATVSVRRNRRRARRAAAPAAAPVQLFHGLTPHLRAAATVVVVLGVAGVALSSLAYSKPLTTMSAPSNGGSADGSSMTFSYKASVPASAAYDGTTVESPLPVFRALTNTVDVIFDYTGQPGALTVVAQLSTDNGWSTTVPLTEERSVGQRHQGTVRLDLEQLDRRATAAAEVIGLPARQLSVKVVPEITFGSGASFAPELQLVADEYALKPVGELTTTSTSGTSAPRETPNQLTVLGTSFDVSTARRTGLLATGLALLLGVAVAALAYFSRPLSEAERVRHRHGSLLLPVLPIALPPGRPVIDVPDISALARIAERYGLLVLHWSRSGVDTYVVQDESTTFRYRAQPAVTSDGPDVADPETVTEHEDVQIARTAAELLTSAPLDVDPAAVVDVDSFQALRDVASLGQYKIHFADDDGLRFYFVLDADTAYRYYSREAADRLDAARATAAEQFGGETVPAPRRPEQRTARSFRRRARV